MTVTRFLKHSHDPFLHPRDGSSRPQPAAATSGRIARRLPGNALPRAASLLALGTSVLCAMHAFGQEQRSAPGVLDVHLGPATGKVVSDLHFGANVEFYRPGLAAGVADRREEFARALRESGVRALRFPGGNAAYWYLPESRSATMSLCPPHVRSMDFVTLEQLARFARGSGVGLIYELPCLFYLDDGTPRAMVRSTYSDKLGYYDRDRVEEGVAYGLNVARHLRELGARVAAWELGNEEFAHCAVQDYAKVVAAYARGLHDLDSQTPVIAVGMGREWLDGLVPRLREAGVLPWIHSFQVHYPFGNWPGPGSPESNADAAAFVGGDLKMERFLDAFAGRKENLGVAALPTSVTETTVMRHQLWDPHAIVGTHAHALCYAWNWMSLLERPEVDVAVFHDLETPFFGILRYDVAFDTARGRFVWLDPAEDQEELKPRFPGAYVPSPTGYANRLLAELVGEELRGTGRSPSAAVRLVASDNRILVVNRDATSLGLRCPFPSAVGEALIADDLAACLPGSYRYAPLAVSGDGGGRLVKVPAWSVACVRRR